MDQQNVKHQFDLTGLKAGEKFLGCPRCWFRFPVGAITRPICPRCLTGMNIYTVTQLDITEPDPVNP
jgi:hypothetical protein